MAKAKRRGGAPRMTGEEKKLEKSSGRKRKLSRKGKPGVTKEDGASSSSSQFAEVPVGYSLGVPMTDVRSSRTPKNLGELFKGKGKVKVPAKDCDIISSLEAYIQSYKVTRRQQEFQVQGNKEHYNSHTRVNPFAKYYIIPGQGTSIRPDEPGWIAGLISFKQGRPDSDKIDVVNFSSGITHIPIFIDKVGPILPPKRGACEPLFILLVESKSVFLTLGFHEFYKRFPCVMLHSWKDKQGHPDFATRWFVKKLHYELELPVLALTQCDPLGMKLLSIYKWGLESDTLDLTIPDLIWLGLTPRDLIEHGIPEICTFRMSPEEEAAAFDFLPKLQDWDLKLTMETLITIERTAEIEALAFRGGTSEYISSCYLPLKLQKLCDSDPLEPRPIGKTCLEGPL